MKQKIQTSRRHLFVAVSAGILLYVSPGSLQAQQSIVGSDNGNLAANWSNLCCKPEDQTIKRVLAIMQTLQYQQPDKFAAAIKSVKAPVKAAGDLHNLSTLQQTAYLAGSRALLPVSNCSKNGTPAVRQIDTTQLQQIYDRLSGTGSQAFALKNGAVFTTAQRDGRFRLFSDDTDFLNWRFLAGGLPVAIRAASTEKGYAGSFVLSTAFPSLTISDDLVITGRRLCQQMRLCNHRRAPLSLTFEQALDPSFADIFAVRGWKRTKHGTHEPAHINTRHHQIMFTYLGLDKRKMIVELRTAGAQPQLSSAGQLRWQLNLPPNKDIVLTETITPHVTSQAGGRQQTAPDETAATPLDPHELELDETEADRRYKNWLAEQTAITTDNRQFNRLIDRAYRDLYILRQPTPGGMAIAAGLPWYAAAFGRDDLIAAWQTLPFMPSLGRMVLKTLAFYQGTKYDTTTAEKPGKIMHELRLGEMAADREVPFGPYYGSVDATPLWVMLLGRYARQTGDTVLVRQLEPNLRSALNYLQAESERGKGYLTYGGDGKQALANQGWKDSGDSISYSDGRLVEAPVALCEVQGYLYDAWMQAAYMEKLLNNLSLAQAIEKRAADLKARFARDFWMQDKQFVALALDGKGRQADVVSSNPGQLLVTGILSPSQSRLVAQRLLQADMFSGFGIRTLSSGQRRYFPNSYHNGSVWPHDNSLIVAGLHACRPDLAAEVTSALLAAAAHETDDRLPELFGGYDRSQVAVPVPYPVSCRPQAWADGALLMMLRSDLGLRIDGENKTISIVHPVLPPVLTTVTLRGLHVGARHLDLQFTRCSGKIEVRVLRNLSKVKVLV